jgi:hypothetical protein
VWILEVAKVIQLGRSYNKYENDFSKYAGHSNKFKAPKSMIKEKDRSEQWQENLIDWITFYRRNIHRFIQHYFGVQLYWYQIIWIYFMSISESFVTIASRASAKSWLIALLAYARACLYPNSEIVIVAASMKQAAIIFGKMARLKDDYSNIAREIQDFSDTQNNCRCVLHNGSTIKVVACQESGRGERSTFTIGEEFRIMDKQKFDSIVKPFAYARQTPYMKNPKYSNIKSLIEEPRQILISSAYHKGLWWYKETLDTIKMMLEGKDAGFIAFDYLIAIKHNIKTKKAIARDRSTMDAITFLEEYENIPFGENSNSFFKLDMFQKNRNIKKAFYPYRKDNFDKKKNPNEIKRTDGEIRIVSVDISTRKGSKNDNTIITCIRGLPTAKGYEREHVYQESHQGEHTEKQALRIKQIYYDFEADYIVLDLQQAGITVFERLAVVTKDEERGVEYDAFTVFEHKSLDKSLIEELKEKTLALNAKPVIYPIMASAKLNNDIAVDFRDKLQRNMCKFLIDENDGEDYLMSKNKEYLNTDDINLKVWYLNHYRQFTEMINETINLEYSLLSGNIKLETVGTARKDRFTSGSYGGFFISLLEQDLLKEQDSDTDLSNFVKHTNLNNNTNNYKNPNTLASKIFR